MTIWNSDTVFDKGSTIKYICKNTVKIDPLSPCLHWATAIPTPLLRTSANVTEYVDVAGHSAGCRLSAGAVYLSIACTSNALVYMLRAAIYSASNFTTI